VASQPREARVSVWAKNASATLAPPLPGPNDVDASLSLELLELHCAAFMSS